jgi:hypothetical protein
MALVPPPATAIMLKKKGIYYMDILRKEYCTRRGRALEAFRTRAKSRGRPVTSDRPPPRRCGHAAWAAAGRPIFANSKGPEVCKFARRLMDELFGIVTGAESVMPAQSKRYDRTT